jgi:hypothetical protein
MLFIGNKRSLLWSGLTLAGKIRKLFSASQPGAWHDYSLIKQQYQDSTGTVPITAVEQPLGLVLDGKTGYARGAELVVNGTFDTSAGWADQSSTSASATISLGCATLTGVDPDNRARYATGVSLTVGKTYIISWEIVSNNTSCQIAIEDGSFDIFGVIPIGFGSRIFTALNPVATLQINVYQAGTVVFESVSIKEIAGNHLTQATAGARPILKNEGGFAARFDGVDDFMSSATGGGATAGFFWCGVVKFLALGTEQHIWSDLSSNNGYAVVIDGASSVVLLVAGNGTNLNFCGATVPVVLGEAALITAWDDGNNLNIQINSSPVFSIARPVVTAGTTSFTEGKNNTSASNYFNGNIYPSIYRTGTPLTAVERAAAQAWCKSKAGL